MLSRVLFLKQLFDGDIVSYAVLSVMSVANYVLPTYNAALNRPAYQSSAYSDAVYGLSFNASLANDGIRETDATKDNKARCSISQLETNPWWAVDLGRPTTVYRVDLTNRGDGGGVYLFCLEFCKGQRLFRSVHSVRVEVSDTTRAVSPLLMKVMQESAEMLQGLDRDTG